MNFVWVALGGAAGSVLRYFFNTLIGYLGFQTTWATGLVNVIGCFILGYLFAYIDKNVENTWVRPALMTGFCGGLTTFSTFTMEIYVGILKKELLSVSLYIAISFLMGLLAFVFGNYMGQK